jgi:phosphopantetheine adenylyltransferase
MLTQKDLDAIKDLVGVTTDEILEKKLEEKLRYFPSKEEFFKRIDEVMKELKAIREEKSVLTHQVIDHEDRITNLEEVINLPTS